MSAILTPTPDIPNRPTRRRTALAEWNDNDVIRPLECDRAGQVCPKHEHFERPRPGTSGAGLLPFVDGATVAVQMCACGGAMQQDTRGIWTCAHCDGACHKSCAPDALCGKGGTKCPGCIGLAIGTRKKREAHWLPPRLA